MSTSVRRASVPSHLDGPVFSIITPSYNQDAYLLATLESVANQTYPFVEHIVMDGGSTDGSVEMLSRWAQSHPITWHSGADEGQASAIQRGVEMARGDVVAWLNSDDVYLDDSVLAEVAAEFSAGAVMVTGAGRYISEDGQHLDRIPAHPGFASHEALRYRDWILQPATFVRRDLFLSCPLDTTLHYAFDWDQFIRLSARFPFTVKEREWAGYRIHAESKSVAGGADRFAELLEVTRRNHPRESYQYAVTLFTTRLTAWAGRVSPRLARRVRKAADGWSRASFKFWGRGIPI